MTSNCHVGVPLRGWWFATLVLAVGLCHAPRALALPIFATQTGMACEQCHTVAFGPALTPYGREFKLNGYVWGDQGNKVPVAFMLMGSYTQTGTNQPEPPDPHYGVNENTNVDQASLFLGGRIAREVGAFVQITYSGTERAASWDNLDVRYAHALTLGDKSLVVGVSLNNNPTVQDLWNSTPGWGFPYISSSLAPTPAEGPMIAGLGQSVLGATAYAMIDGRYYIEAGGYKGLSNHWLNNMGLDADNNANISGVAPYWRAAVQFDGPVHHYSFGTFGLATRIVADPTIAATDNYRDIGLDATYQYAPRGSHALAANIALTRETRHLASSFATGASDAVDNHVTFLNADLTYCYERTWSAAVSAFGISGSTNTGLYAPGPVGGSANSSPDSSGYTLQLEYIPFGKAGSFMSPHLNVRVGLQYVGYTKFNGGTTNYDGFGRSASDNNTLFAYLWLII